MTSIQRTNPEEICISAITYAELMQGFFSPVTILEFDNYAAEEYGLVRAEFEKKGTSIGPMDMLIAGHPRAKGIIVVTNNTREFIGVEGMQVEDWTQESA